MSNTTFVIDWDGTCVENKYPEQGDWLPGAVNALHLFDRLGTAIIFSVRIAPVKPFTEGKAIPHPGTETPFDDGQPEREIAYIQRKLDEANLGHLEIWQRSYKPPAFVYIDDRAVHFDGDWHKTIETVMERMAPIGDQRSTKSEQLLGEGASPPYVQLSLL